jgi:altronate dehydratase large subunit
MAVTAAAVGSFWGYPRSDGSVGVRNHLLVVPSVICANTVAQRVASLIPGAVAIPHPHGCAQVGDDVVLTERVLAGAAASPNVGAALFIGLGCETCQASGVADRARALAPGKPIESFFIQEAGGSIQAIARGVEAGKRLLAEIASQQRRETPLAALTLAIETAEPDETTERIAAPLVEAVAQRVLAGGGTVLTSPASAGRPADAPGETVLAVADRPAGPGRFAVDAPAQDAVSITAKAVAGAQVCLFATGGGSPLGSALYPVLKVSANAATIAQMEDNVDFAATSLVNGPPRPVHLAADLFRLLMDVCNGQLTNAEMIGHQEFAIHRIGPTV